MKKLAQFSIARRTKKSINKKAIKEIPEGEYPIPNGFRLFDVDGGQILLNVVKRKKTGHFYQKNEYNDVIRRVYNLDPEKFRDMIAGYRHFSKIFPTKKSMVKFFKKTRAKERQKGHGI